MKRSYLFAYQLLTGLSDTSTGLLLIFAPELALRLMHVQVPTDALPYLSYIGAFVLSVGLACFYGAILTRRILFTQKLETVWLLTAITRGCVAAFVLANVLPALPGSWPLERLVERCRRLKLHPGAHQAGAASRSSPSPTSISSSSPSSPSSNGSPNWVSPTPT